MSSNQGILVISGDKPVFVNTKAIRYTGFSEEELYSLPVTHYIHPDDAPDIINLYLGKDSSQHPPEGISFRISKKNGEIRWVELKTQPIRWNGVNATLCFLTDITRHKKYEQERYYS